MNYRIHLLSLLITLSCLTGPSVSAQEVQKQLEPHSHFSSIYQHFNSTTGLFNNQVRFMEQMQDGRILVYTEGMFNLYDGHTFQTMTCNLEHTIPLGMHNKCTTYKVSDSLLWAKDFFHLYLINTYTGRFESNITSHFDAAELHLPINDFILDADNTAWLITSNGAVYRYDWKHKAKPVFLPTAAQRRKSIRVIDVIQAGPFHLIVMNSGLIYCWEEKSGRIVSTDHTLERNEASLYMYLSWIKASSSELLIGVNNPNGELYSYNIYTQNWHKLYSGEKINDIKPCTTGKGGYWVAAGNTLLHVGNDFTLTNESKQFQAQNNQIINDNIQCLLPDKQGGLWLGLSTHGVLRTINQAHHINFFTPDKNITPQARYMRAMKQYDDKHLIVGTFNGVYLFNLITHQFSAPWPQLSHVYCADIQVNNDGVIYVSTRQGFYTINTKTQQPEHINTPHPVVRFTLPLHDGGTLLCANLTDLYLKPAGKQEFEPLRHTHQLLNPSRALSFALETAPGKLLLGAQNGLFCYNTTQQRLERIKWSAEYERYSVKYNCAAQQGSKIWIGTQNGLLLHDQATGSTMRYTTTHGLPNNCIQGIAIDKQGNLWVSTSYGVAWIKEKKDGIVISVLNSHEGYEQGEMVEQSIETALQGNIYVGSTMGITEIPAHIAQEGSHSFSPTLVGLKVCNHTISNEGLLNGREILPQGMSYTHLFRLKHNENYLELTLSALNYETPWRTRYRYRLLGLDDKWTEHNTSTGICSIIYTSLPAGRYVLEAQTAMNGDAWGAPAQWTIIIEPPMWLTWWAYTIYIIVILSVIYYILKLYFKNKKAQLMAEQEALKHEKEQQLDELKFRFFTNISHEFRTPLALIITPLELLIKHTSSTELKNSLNRILLNAKSLLELVNTLLDFRKLEQQGETLKASCVVVKPFFTSLTARFADMGKSKHIEVSCDCALSDTDMFCMDSKKMSHVITNLLSNAIKFTPEGGTVSVTVSWTEMHDYPGKKAIQVEVSDSGCGMSPEEIPHVFDRFYQANSSMSAPSAQTGSSSTGSGIGLHLVKGYIDLHHGTIQVNSEKGIGTTFTICIPEAETAIQQVTEAVTDTPVETPTATTKATTLLIVEDNEQFKRFMSDLLEPQYNIITASHGTDGLAKAKQLGPDLIISDVMMPEMNGYELCKALKSDVSCSHIPIILLTARTSDESRSEAYEMGADSYITKPFDIDVLSSRIHQLLENRERRHNLIKHTESLDPKEVTITSLDEQLLQKALELIEKNMDNADYGVEALSSDLCIERSSLYRKMQAIAGQTPSEFIRTIRLKRAAQLLTNTQYTVQEIAWMVGFGTPRYFSSYFKEMFGMTPSAYAAEKRKKTGAL